MYLITFKHNHDLFLTVTKVLLLVKPNHIWDSDSRDFVQQPSTLTTCLWFSIYIGTLLLEVFYIWLLKTVHVHIKFKVTALVRTLFFFTILIETIGAEIILTFSLILINLESKNTSSYSSHSASQ